MYLVYMDEAGDDAFSGQSELFIVTSVYMHYKHWRNNFLKIQEFRREIRDQYGLQTQIELHMRKFILDKNPYKQLNWKKSEKLDILYRLFRLISQLDIRIVNVVINKKNIVDERYNIFENSIRYSVQRIENDLTKHSLTDSFMIIADEGRIEHMRKVTRRIQRYNYIPSKIELGTSYRKEVARMIEDPMEKSSEESRFIQLADAISYITYLYAIKKFNSSPWGKRIERTLSEKNVMDFLNIIKERLNLFASSKNVFGIVQYPEK